MKDELKQKTVQVLAKLTSPARLAHYRGIAWWGCFASTWVEALVTCGRPAELTKQQIKEHRSLGLEWAKRCRQAQEKGQDPPPPPSWPKKLAFPQAWLSCNHKCERKEEGPRSGPHVSAVELHELQQLF